MLALALTATLVVTVASISLAPSKALETAAAGDAANPPFAPAEWLKDVERRVHVEQLEVAAAPIPTPDPKALPVGSGAGAAKRVVFDISAQRVWLVRSDGSVRLTYPVSGSKHDNLRPGKYKVYSRSRNATSFDFGSTMNYFVRFTKGANAAIGFHDIPVANSGRVLQSKKQLGKPLSSGCIRQKRSDAKLMWNFAPIGTRVVVLA